MQLWQAQDVRAVDAAMADVYHHPTLLLMERAGAGVAHQLANHYPHLRHALVLCGPGNNGGDGLTAARHLHLMGWTPWVLMTHPPTQYTGDAATQLRMAQALGLRLTTWDANQQPDLAAFIRQGAVVLDALLGVGASGPWRQPMASLVDAIRALGPLSVVAIDLPSGLDANTGAVEAEPLTAELTCTLGRPKPALYLTPAANHAGHVVVVDLGHYPQAEADLAPTASPLTPHTVRANYRPRPTDGHKNHFGHVLVVGGSTGKAGAVALASLAALELGAGLVTGLLPGSCVCAFHRTTLESMALPYGQASQPHLDEDALPLLQQGLEDKSAVCMGPGMGQHQATASFFAQALALVADRPLILDADALNLLAANPSLLQQLPPATVLTPHPGEMARLLGTTAQAVQADRLAHARTLAQRTGAVVVLKGAGTLVMNPNGTYAICPAGNAGMATAGTGDVLSGATAALLAQGYQPAQAAGMAVLVHATAGDRLRDQLGMEGLTAGKLAGALSPTLTDLLHQGQATQA